MKETHYIREGLANMWKGKEAVGGKLYLSSEMLHHKPHAINFQREETYLPLTDISKVERERSRLLGLPLINNGLKVTTHEGHEVRYVVNKAGEWVNAIERAAAEAKKQVVM